MLAPTMRNWFGRGAAAGGTAEPPEIQALIIAFSPAVSFSLPQPRPYGRSMLHFWK